MKSSREALRVDLESALAATDPAATTLVLEGLSAIEGRSPSSITTAAARCEGTRGLRLGLVDPKGPTCELRTVQSLDRLFGVVIGLELYEGKSTHPARHLVERHEHILHRADGAEGLLELFLGNIETQVAGKHFARNDILLFRSSHESIRADVIDWVAKTLRRDTSTGAVRRFGRSRVSCL